MKRLWFSVFPILSQKEGDVYLSLLLLPFYRLADDLCVVGRNFSTFCLLSYRLADDLCLAGRSFPPFRLLSYRLTDDLCIAGRKCPDFWEENFTIQEKTMIY